jgi:hypothetical protein
MRKGYLCRWPEHLIYSCIGQDLSVYSPPTRACRIDIGLTRGSNPIYFFNSHNTTQTLTTRTHTHPYEYTYVNPTSMSISEGLSTDRSGAYEYTYVNPTPMSISEGLSTDRSGDSWSHHWRLIVDRNVAYHLTHNAEKSRNKFKKKCEHQDLNPSG